jgi:hypothetical protein
MKSNVALCSRAGSFATAQDDKRRMGASKPRAWGMAERNRLNTFGLHTIAGRA